MATGPCRALCAAALLAACVTYAHAGEETSLVVTFGFSGGYTSTNGGLQESCITHGLSGGGRFLAGALVSGQSQAHEPCDAGRTANARGDLSAWASSRKAGSQASLLMGPRTGFSMVDGRAFAGATIQGQVRIYDVANPGATGMTGVIGGIDLNWAFNLTGPSAKPPVSVGKMSASVSFVYTLGQYVETDYETLTFDSISGISSDRNPGSVLFELGATNSFFTPYGTWIPFRITAQSEVGASGIGQGASEYFEGIADFFNTAALPVGAPIFRLPAGFSAESPGLGIVDNRIVVQAVPEPSLAWSMGAGLAVLARCLRRRTDRVTRRRDERSWERQDRDPASPTETTPSIRRWTGDAGAVRSDVVVHANEASLVWAPGSRAAA